MSFNPYSVAVLRKINPGMVLGLVTGPFDEPTWSLVPDARLRVLRDTPDLERVSAGFVSHKYTDLSVGHVANAKAAGLPVIGWTVKSPDDEKIARRIADNITFEGYLPKL